jgi:hypothetical protein
MTDPFKFVAIPTAWHPLTQDDYNPLPTEQPTPSPSVSDKTSPLPGGSSESGCTEQSSQASGSPACQREQVIPTSSNREDEHNPLIVSDAIKENDEDGND